MSTNIKVTLTLEGEDNWFEWIETVKTVAKKSDIWEYIDPEVEDSKLTKLEPPVEPKLKDVYQRVTPESIETAQTELQITWKDLTTSEFQLYSFLTSQYQYKEKKYMAKKTLIEDMRFQIQQSISKDHLIYTTNCLTTHDILVSLKRRFQPSTKIRERQLIREYQALKTFDYTTLVEPWLLRWDMVVRKCQKIDLPETQGSRPLFDFIEAIQGKYPTFFSIWNIRLIEGSHDIELYQLIQVFRDHQKSLNPRATHAKHTAFLAFARNTSRTPCVCGKNHLYKDCWTLNPSKSPAGWIPS
ncbi:hypothetical protein OIDMADRAFT_136538, partial [Oidiodendron maius Zn]